MACKARDCSQSLVESSHAFACFGSSGSTASLYTTPDRFKTGGHGSAWSCQAQNLDLKYNKDMCAWCFWPGDVFGRGGRACVMQIYSGGAARNKLDMMAFEMTVATQRHNSTAAQSLNAAGASVVARFLGANRGCN